MKTRTNLLHHSFSGPDLGGMLHRFVASHAQVASVPEQFSIDHDPATPSLRWVDEGMAQAKRTFSVNWDPVTDPCPALISVNKRAGAFAFQLRVDWSVSSVAGLTGELNAQLAVFGAFHWDQRWGNRERWGFASGHASPGWGCAFRGEKGHEQLVSRRWLEYGPWLLFRFDDDISLIQFHDLDADSETALVQAQVGHRRLADHVVGGYLRASYRPAHDDVQGLYVPEDRTLRFVRAPGKDVPESEMLDACAHRLIGRYRKDQPIDAVRYIFIEPADAQRHLHELWLRELEVWTFRDGKEVRIDLDYRPTPARPSWVEEVIAAGEGPTA